MKEVSTSQKPSSGINTVKGLYEKYVQFRSPYLERARDCAMLSIPPLIPPESNSKTTTYPTPYQGLGARGTNNLASKLLLALLPPGQPCFKLAADDFTIEELAGKEELRAEIEEAFNKIERSISTDIDSSSIRVTTFEMFKHLIVGGNCLMYFSKEGYERLYPLNRYVCKRDPMGRLMELLTLDYASPKTLSPELKGYLQIDSGNTSIEENIEIYTYIRLSGNLWLIHQECQGKVIPGSGGTYPIDKLPWLPLRWTKVANEDYGRGYIEEYYGDLKSLEELTKAIVQGSAAAARVIFLVAPNAITKAKDLDEAPNGAIRVGLAEDITTVQLEKYNDFKVALETIEMITQRLSFAFMLNTAIQRQGERVTAEEIRYMAGELEDALGGIYSILTQEFQLPLVQLKMEQMQSRQLIPRLPKGSVKPVITTGLEALGRSKDLEKMRIFLEHLNPLGPEVLQVFMNLDNYIKRTGTALNIDMSGLIKSKEEIKEAEQQKQAMSMMERLGPNAINQFGGAMNQDQ